jgi:hypothetical protein
VTTVVISEESCHESASFSEKNLQELQDRAPPGRYLRHLRGEKAQTETGLITSTDLFSLLLPTWRIRYNVLFT